MNVEQLIKDYLSEAKVMQLATVNGTKLWICTVNYTFDNDYNLYWMSSRSRRHSQDLEISPTAAVAIVKDPNIKRGLQFEGEAYEVAEVDLEKAHKLYSQRYDNKVERLTEAKSSDKAARSYYIFKPKLVVLFDEVNFPDNPRQEWRPKSA